MSDPNTPENPSTPAVEPDADATPTEAMAPVPAAAPQASVSDQASGRHTRTILEVAGGVAAAVLIVVAAGVGFVAGIAVGDSDDRDGRGYEQAGEMRGGHGDRGHGHDGAMGRGYGDGPMDGPMNEGVMPQG
jgi:hypothetical protein